MLRVELTFADVRLDLLGRRAWRAGKPVKLRPTEFQLLCRLAARPRYTATAAELHEEVLGRAWQTESNVIQVHISRLREALGETLRKADLVVTTEYGYSLEADVNIEVFKSSERLLSHL